MSERGLKVQRAVLKGKQLVVVTLFCDSDEMQSALTADQAMKLGHALLKVAGEAAQAAGQSN